MDQAVTPFMVWDPKEHVGNSLWGMWVSDTVKVGAKKWGEFQLALLKHTSWGPMGGKSVVRRLYWRCPWGPPWLALREQTGPPCIGTRKWRPSSTYEFDGFCLWIISYIIQGEYIQSPKAWTRAKSRRLGWDILGMCRDIDCQAFWHLCVMTTAGVALFTCQFIILFFFSLIFHLDKKVFYIVCCIRQEEDLKKKTRTHTKIVFLFEFFPRWLADKGTRGKWRSPENLSELKAIFEVRLHTMISLTAWEK